MKVVGEGRELLERLAGRHGLDALVEIHAVQEGEFPAKPEQKAFALLGFGLPIYREMAHPQYFPAKSGGARRQGGRGVRESLSAPAGERAVIFMAHAVPAYAVAFWQCQARSADSEVDDASWYEEYHASVRGLLGDFYPLDAEDEQALVDARREVDVFETHVPTDSPDLPSKTGYARPCEMVRTPTVTPG
jgi:hypothetical protein